MYFIRKMTAHCHHCGKLTVVVSRVNQIRPQQSKKTDLCEPCAIKVFSPVAQLEERLLDTQEVVGS